MITQGWAYPDPRYLFGYRPISNFSISFSILLNIEKFFEKLTATKSYFP